MIRATFLTVTMLQIVPKVWGRGDNSGIGQANAIETQLLNNGFDMSLGLAAYNTYNEISDVHDLHGEFSLSLRVNAQGKVYKN